MKKIIAMVFITSVVFSTHVLAGDLKVGCVDMPRALNESEAGISAMKSLESEYKKRDEEINTRQEELKKLKEEIDKKSYAWNKETRDKRESEFASNRRMFEVWYNKSGEQLIRVKQETEERIIRGLWAIVEELAARDGYSFVLARSVSGVLYCDPKVDLTDGVIKEHNKRFKSSK